MDAREIAPWRLNLLRCGYLLLAVGLGVQVWPRLLRHDAHWPHMNSVVGAMLSAIAAVALLGLRYPLQTLPLLLFEVTWKTLWLGFVAAPLALAGPLHPRIADTAGECLATIVLLPLIPWDHVVSQYVLKRGERWR